MSDKEREDLVEEARDVVGEQGSFDPEDGAEERITLDRYYSRRRPAIRSGWTHIVSLVAMLVALVMIMIYKDHCGQQVSELMGTMGPADAGGVPVRYQLPEEKGPEGQKGAK